MKTLKFIVKAFVVGLILYWASLIYVYIINEVGMFALFITILVGGMVLTAIDKENE